MFEQTKPRWRLDRRSRGLKRCRQWLPAIIAGLAAVAGFQIKKNSDAFSVEDVTYSQHAQPAWTSPQAPQKAFRPVNLPFYNGAGYFRIKFQTDQTAVKVTFRAQDCVRQVYLDGRKVFSRQKRCQNCRITSSSPLKPHCYSEVLLLEPQTAGPHLLAVQTQNVRGPSRTYNVDQTVFWLEHKHNATLWRILLLVCLLTLLAIILSYVRYRNSLRFWLVLFGRARRYRIVLGGFALIAFIRIAVSPAHLTTDVNQATHLYVENIVHKSDWSYATLDEDYTAAKHEGRSYMHKPPGLYYQYIPARIYFGFTRIYASYMARIPGLVGDLIIALVLFQVVRRKTRDQLWANLASTLYLFAPGTFLVNGYIGRVDALPVAFILLAVSNMRRLRFIGYFGAAALLKQLAVLIGPWFIVQKRLGWKVLAAALVTLTAMLPFLIDDASLTFKRLTSPQLSKGISGLSWMQNFKVWGMEDPNALANTITVGFVLGLVLISPFLRGNPHRVAAFIFVSFLLFARNMAEHYLLWAAPFLVIYFCISRRMLPLMVFGVLQIYGLLANDRAFFLVGRILNDMALVLAVPLLIYFLVELPALFRPREAISAYTRRLSLFNSNLPSDTRKTRNTG